MSAPDAWGLSYRQVVSLCWLAYKGQGSVGRWKFSDGTTWTLTEVNEVLSFRAVLVTSPSGRKILSYSGTDEAADWIDNVSQRVASFSPQYSYAAGIGLYYRPDIVVGHSLGGGLATFTGIRWAIPTATLNPASLTMFSAAPTLLTGGRVINYVVRGEILDILDNSDPFSTRIGSIHYVQSNGKDEIEKHKIDFLTGFVPPAKVSFYEKFVPGKL